MRRNIVILGIIISTIAVVMILIGIGGTIQAENALFANHLNSNTYQQQVNTYATVGGFGIIFLIIGIPLTLIGLVLKSKEQKQISSTRRCPKCGREIPFDAVVCPYCQYDFK